MKVISRLNTRQTRLGLLQVPGHFCIFTDLLADTDGAKIDDYTAKKFDVPQSGWGQCLPCR